MRKNIRFLAILATMLGFSFGFFACGKKPLSTDKSTDKSTIDTDGDGIPDINDPYPNDPTRPGKGGNGDGTGTTDQEDPVKTECKNDGEWVTVVDSGTVSQDIKNCLTEKSFDESIEVRVYWCADDKDILLITGGIMSIRTVSTGLGQIGAFAGMHSDCSRFSKDGASLKDNALVFVKKDSPETKMEWKHPGILAFNLDLPNIDPNSPTRITDIEQATSDRLTGIFGALLNGMFLGIALPWSFPGIITPVTINYSNANNNFGPGNLSHMFFVNDPWSGPWIYGIKFKYSYNTIKTGTYE